MLAVMALGLLFSSWSFFGQLSMGLVALPGHLSGSLVGQLCIDTQ
jgi:hypothetical protein